MTPKDPRSRLHRIASSAAMVVGLAAPAGFGVTVAGMGDLYPDTGLAIAFRVGGLALASLPVAGLGLDAWLSRR